MLTSATASAPAASIPRLAANAKPVLRPSSMIRMRIGQAVPIAVPRDELERVVDRAVVDDHDLSRGTGLGGQRPQALRQPPPPVPVRNDDRDLHPQRHAARVYPRAGRARAPRAAGLALALVRGSLALGGLRDHASDAGLEVPGVEALGVGAAAGRIHRQRVERLQRGEEAVRVRAVEERSRDSLLHSLQRPSVPQRDHGTTGGLGFHRSDSELLGGGHHERPGPGEQLRRAQVGHAPGKANVAGGAAA